MGHLIFRSSSEHNNMLNANKPKEESRDLVLYISVTNMWSLSGYENIERIVLALFIGSDHRLYVKMDDTTAPEKWSRNT